ncbi:MAG: thiamine-phosphate kinase [Methanomassiliicoccales archaeon]
MTLLSEIGEKAAVRRIQEIIARRGGRSNIGPGDDAAAIEVGDAYVVITTDLIAQSTHIVPGMSPWQIGWSLAAINFSDVAAMGAKPLGLLVSMGLTPDMQWETLDEILEGILDCCARINTELLGGDTKETKELTMVGTALGRVEKNRILLRKGASPGDLLAITGSVGLAAAGYQSLRKGLGFRMAEKALLEPQPRVEEGMMLSSSQVVTSCMDVSDGLASSVYALSESSGVSFVLEHEEIPVEEMVLEIAEAVGMDANELALYFGGDYQLLFTIKPEGLGKLRSLMGEKFSVIGRAIPKSSDNVIARGRDIVKLENRGYEHFRKDRR